VSRASFGAGWAWWGIGGVALLLSVWAVFDFVDAMREEAARGVAPSTAAEQPPPSPLDAVELHRLLPDATDDLGALVRVDGTVAAVGRDGFWVRDLRDNIVYVALPSGGWKRRGGATLAPGAAVSVLGVIGLVAPREAPSLDTSELAAPVSAVVIRDIRILPLERGVVVLAN